VPEHLLRYNPNASATAEMGHSRRGLPGVWQQGSESRHCSTDDLLEVRQLIGRIPVIDRPERRRQTSSNEIASVRRGNTSLARGQVKLASGMNRAASLPRGLNQGGTRLGRFHRCEPRSEYRVA
jgi:hypothetical protein